jgi:hypothetical protein
MSAFGPAPPTALTLEGFLQLADFIQNPQYIDRVRELHAATADHHKTLVQSAAQLKKTEEAQKKLDADSASHAKDVAEFQTQKALSSAGLIATETGLRQREAALKQREQDHAEMVSEDIQLSAASKASMEATAKSLNKKNAELDKMRTELDKRAADLERRFAKLKEAAL